MRRLIVVHILLAVALPAGAAEHARGHADAGALPAKPAPMRGKAAANGPSHLVQEGGVAHPIWIDTARVVEFPAGGVGRPAIRSARPGEVDDARRAARPDAKASATTPPAVAAPAVSPLFKDAAGQPRALAGGVIIGLKEALPADEARVRLAADGLSAVRQINALMWLVDSPVGVASLELATRLHETGRYEFVQPNWWKPRTTK